MAAAFARLLLLCVICRAAPSLQLAAAHGGSQRPLLRRREQEGTPSSLALGSLALSSLPKFRSPLAPSVPSEGSLLCSKTLALTLQSTGFRDRVTAEARVIVHSVHRAAAVHGCRRSGGLLKDVGGVCR